MNNLENQLSAAGARRWPPFQVWTWLYRDLASQIVYPDARPTFFFYLQPGPESSKLNPGVLMQDPVLSALAVAINVPGN